MISPVREPELSQQPDFQPVWEIAYLFPPQGGWSAAEYMALRPNRHVEFTDGFIEVLPMPTYSHQRLLRYLLRALEAFVLARQLGEVMFAPLRVQIRVNKYREPDLVFMRSENLSRCGEEFWIGADLVMEIVSDDARSRERDLETKRADYAEGGILEYWIVDPVEERIVVLHLEGQQYQVHGEFGRGAQATSVLLPGWAVDVSAVLEAGKV
jgi:Uma2 family endonuclease